MQQPTNPGGGENYGWRVREGSVQNPAYPEATPPPGAVDPIFDYPRSVGRTVIGGYIYRGQQIPNLRGLYVFADYLGPDSTPSTGQVFTLNYNGTIASNFQNITAQLFPTCVGGFTLSNPSSLGEDANGELYITDIGNGSVFKIVASAVRSDFNGDGKPDYVLYNASTRRTAVWYLNNNVFLSSAYGPTLPAGWTLVDAADFNRNGETDYALFNPSTRQTAIWYLSGVAFRGGAFGPTLPSGWALVAVGDFDGDCSPDYVLYNASTGQTAVWYVTDSVFAGGDFGPALPGVWRVVGVADFNGDGKLDYLLFNGGTRQSAIWYLSGVTFAGGAFGPTIAGGYQLTGAADFNGDGSPDYVLYNPSIQRTAIWYMNNNVLLSGSFGPTLPGAWNLVAP